MLAAALALAAFGAGFLLGNGGDSDASAFKPVRTVVLGNQGKTAVVRVGKPDAPAIGQMLLTVEGLRRLPEGDYYTLFMTRKGKAVATCGTFKVSGTERKDVRFTVGTTSTGTTGYCSPSTGSSITRTIRSCARRSSLRRDAAGVDERGVGQRHVPLEERLCRGGELADLILRGLVVP